MPPPVPLHPHIHNHQLVYNHFQPYYPAYNALPANQMINPFPLSPAPPTPALPVTSSLRALLTATHIPVLTSKLDFFAWDEGVTSLIWANGLISHILDPSEPIDPNCPDHMPAIIPVLSYPPLPQDIAALNHWWDEANIFLFRVLEPFHG